LADFLVGRIGITEGCRNIVDIARAMGEGHNDLLLHLLPSTPKPTHGPLARFGRAGLPQLCNARTRSGLNMRISVAQNS
jgi:hypothetical protein